MKKIVLLLLACFAPGVWADVSIVNEWQPQPTRAAEMFQRAVEAQHIFERLGAATYLGTDQNGHLHFVVSFADWGAWAKFEAAADADKELAAFSAKIAADPAATSLGVTFLDQPLVAKTTPVTVVYGWKVKPGRLNDFVALAQEAAAIQSKLGASPGISIDDLGNVWYETACESWAAWAAFEAALQKSPEWAAFLKKANADPTGELMRVIRVQQYTPPK